ncbi:MAG TPA: hypothetical protein VEV17_17300 [Bryobacteraceae bacterium]|nr:hypothetical protein [Bryobacteraceae bacterium]
MRTISLTALMLGLGAWTAYAQSSGSFTYGNTGGTHCVLNGNNGAITGGAICSSGADCTALGCSPIPAPSGKACSVDSDCASGLCASGQCAVGTCGGSIVAGIKTNSGSGNVFDIRPSAVIGLLTDVAVQKNSTINVGTSSAFAGVDFSLAVTPPAGAPTPCISPNFSVTYASRFIQISTNLFTVLGNLCTTVTNANTVGGVTTSVGCFISFDESTVSAHSFDWIVGFPDSNATANGNPANCGTLSTGVYGIAANWKASLGNSGISEALTCVGPVNLTVTQNKIFSFNTVN